MYFRILHDESQGLVSYLLADLDAREAVVIDPRAQDVRIIEAMLQEHHLLLKARLFTHAHDSLAPADAQIRSQQLQQGGLIELGAEHLRILNTPGHTADCLSFLWRDRLFCGGLLSAAECPRQPKVAAPQAMWDSVMNTVFKLPAETLTFSSHARATSPVSTVMTQRRHHPWFSGLSRDDFLNLMPH